jgi:hypothetical protein
LLIMWRNLSVSIVVVEVDILGLGLKFSPKTPYGFR